MEPIDREMTLRDYWRVIRNRKWIVIVAIVVSVGGALGLALAQTPIYATSAQVIVQPRQSGGLFQTQGGAAVTNERTVQTEIQVIEGETVRQRVQDNLGLDQSPPAVDASAVGQTDVISVSIRNTDPATAETLANAYAQAYIDVRREQAVGELLAASAEVQNTVSEIQLQVDELADDDPLRAVLVAQQAAFRQTLNQLQVDAALRTGGASIITPADLPTDPVEPTPLRSAVLAGVVGLLIGLGAAFLKDYLDDAIRTEEDLERAVPLPVLAVIPVDPPPDNLPIAISRPEDYAVETYRGLRTNVQFLGIGRTLRVLQVTSSLAAEGKTTTATNLAVVLAQADKRVLLVDADLRRPRLHEVFAVLPSPGLTNLILGEASGLVIDSLELNDATRLDLLTAGHPPPNPGEMLSGARLGELIRTLADSYDYVIMDSAPVLPVADSIALASVADGVLVVVQAGRASSKIVQETIERLQRVGAPILGLVLNQASAKSAGADGYGYGYDRRGKSTPPTLTRAPDGSGRIQRPVEVPDLPVDFRLKRGTIARDLWKGPRMRRYIFGIAAAVTFMVPAGAAAQDYPPDTSTTTTTTTTMAPTTTASESAAAAPNAPAAPQPLAGAAAAPAPAAQQLPATGGSGFGTTTTVAIGLLIAGLGILAVARVRRRGAELPS